MQVIAQRGSDTFMLLTEGRRDRLNTATVRVFNRETNYVGPEMPALSVLARGYWVDPEPDLDLKAIVAEAEGALAAPVAS